MAEYIERKATCKDCFHYCVCKDTVADENWEEDAPKEVREMFSPSGCKNYVPAADVVEVRHGNWYGTIVNNVRRVDCSECGATYALVDIEGDLQDLFYCPNCGAKMDGKDEKR